jgi:lipopolysaccharide transport system ATP-binding protein
MSKAHISLHNVNLHYSSVAYKERSIKTMLAHMFKYRPNKVEIEDIHALKNVSVEIHEGEKVGLLWQEYFLENHVRFVSHFKWQTSHTR